MMKQEIRDKRERKLVALMLKDLESNVAPEELAGITADAANLSDEELDSTLKSRLDLSGDVTDEELDGRLAFVEEPEVLSASGTEDPATTPDLSHNEDAKN